MVRHIVWWTLKEQAEGYSAAENARRIKDASGMLSGIPGVLSCEVSCQIEPTSTVAAQLVLTSTHESAEALAAYQVNPVHVKFAGIIKAVCASRSSLDFEI